MLVRWRRNMAGARRDLAIAASIAACVASIPGCVPAVHGELECFSEPPARIAFDGTVDDTATVGFIYRQPISASAGTLLGQTHAIWPIEAPGDATVDAYGVTWTPPAALAGTAQPFRVRSDRDFCGGTAELSWSVYVHPPIQILRFEAAPAAVSTRGTALQLVAEYAGGEGQLSAPFAAAMASGVPLDAGVVNATTEFRLAVRGPGGDVLERSLTVQAQSPPEIATPSFFPALASAGDTVTLHWSLGGTVTGLTVEPGGIVLSPFASSLDVVAALGLTYTVTARNDAGDVASVAISPSVLPRPAVSSFTASPPDPAYLGTTAVTAVFENGEGVLRWPDAPDGIPVASGVPVTVGPLHRNAQLRLDVSNGPTTVRELLFVGLDGPGTWEILPEGAGAGLAGHTATLLPGGRVLVAGGRLGSGSSAGTAIWDPVGGATAPGPPLLHPRSGHAAALLRDGRVLLAGGTAPGGAPVDEAELLDVEAGTSAPAGSVGDAWWVPQLVALPDGSAVLHPASMFWSPPILRFDPGASTVSQLTVAGGMGWVRSFALADGRVLLLSGGQYALTPSAILDPSTGALSPTGATLRQMSGFEAVAIADGRILALDGEAPAEIFDPAAGTFAWTGSPVATGRAGRAALLAGGEVLVSGATSMRYDPATGAFRETGGMLEDAEQPLVLLPDGTVIATGGSPQRYRP
jgi:hypothetical protein